jgi:prepilin-type processing-associated H-X9-DG protein
MKKSRAFVLVELMIVIEVIILLAAMLLPALSRARESARRAACLSNLKQIIVGIKTYAADYDDCYPTSAGAGRQINTETHYKDLGILYPWYVPCLDAFACPSSGDELPWRRTGDEDRIFRLDIVIPVSGETIPRAEQKQSDAKPFSDDEASQVSYAYGYNGGGETNVAWTEAAHPGARVLADRHASEELNERSNHGASGRNVAFADGHVQWVPGKTKLLTNPMDPDPKLRDQSWWSERPDRPRNVAPE